MALDNVDGAAKAVRQIRNNLAPLQLEKNLSQPLRLLIEQFSARNNIETQVFISPEVDTRIAAEARHALYRVVQQALDNIAAHARASHVSIRIEPIQERLHFSITDDGQGFSAAQRTSQGGEFTIQPGPQAGTSVSGWLPMRLSASPSASSGQAPSALPTVAGQAPAREIET